MVDHSGTGQSNKGNLIHKGKKQYSKKELDKKLGGWKKSKTGAEYRCSDPGAFPTATQDEIKEVEERIRRAKKANRWVIVGEYGEEWQRIMLQSINGLNGMGKIHAVMTPEKTGAVRPLLGGDYVETDDMSMMVDGVDKQMRRMTALLDYFDAYNVTRRNEPIDPEVIVSIKKVQRGLKDILKMRRPSFCERVKYFFKSLFKRKRVSKFTEYRDILIAGMESAGFVFDTEEYLYVGEKFIFDKELFFIGKPKENKTKNIKKVKKA